MIAPSPAPLTPSGLLGDRWFSSVIARISAAFRAQRRGVVVAVGLADFCVFDADSIIDAPASPSRPGGPPASSLKTIGLVLIRNRNAES
jgi:hypothetical protein